MKGYIHSFETFGTVDGPGIRFVVFFKGCPLRCKYCHNPDTWTLDNALIMEPQEIVSKIIKYKHYFKDGGGVTLSGGEPLVQLDFVIELCKLLKEEAIHIAIDTSGYPFIKDDVNVVSKFKQLINYVDLFLLDIKHSDEAKHIELTGVSNQNTLDFATFLSKNHKHMWIRHVLVPGITGERSQLIKLNNLIETLSFVDKIEVLPYHTMGINKYQNLGIDYPLKNINPPSKEEIENAKRIFKIL